MNKLQDSAATTSSARPCDRYAPFSQGKMELFIAEQLRTLTQLGLHTLIVETGEIRLSN